VNNLSSLRDMALFVEVARLGSFSKASASLNVPMATLSRRINSLEKEFGIRLFNRSTRNIQLTELGLRYFERCEHIVDEARLAQESLRDASEKPVGHIKITMPVDLGVHVIGPFLPEFSRRYPDIFLDIDLSARNSDLISDKVDIAIRLGMIQDELLIVRQIGSIDLMLYASPAYLDLHGRPTQPQELQQHSCLVAGGSDGNLTWQLESAGAIVSVQVAGIIKANNLGLLKLLAERDMGIVRVAPFLVRDSLNIGRLEPVLPDWSCRNLPVNAVMNSRLKPAAVTTFLEFIQPKLLNMR